MQARQGLDSKANTEATLRPIADAAYGSAHHVLQNLRLTLAPPPADVRDWLLTRWLAATTPAVARAIGKVAGRGTSFDTARAIDAAPADESATFTVVIEHPDFSHPLCVSLDASLSRAICDAFQAQTRSPRGVGPLTDVEKGVLEFASVGVADQLFQFGSGSSRMPRILEFLDGPIKSGVDQQFNDLRWHAVNVRVGANGGEVCIGLAQPAEDLLVPMPVESLSADAFDDRSTLSLRVAIRPVRLETEELDAMEPGDILMLGVTDFRSIGTRALLVTTTGWGLMETPVQLDSPNVLQVAAGPWSIGPWAGATERDPRVIWPTFGSLSVPLHDLATVVPGRSIDLNRDAGDMVLWSAGRPRWRAEVVTVAGERVARLLESIDADSSL